MGMVRLTSGRHRSRRDDESGAVLLMVVAMSMVIFGLAALVVDLGQARVVKREAQAASDSSALAAANALYLAGTETPDVPGAVAAAKGYAEKNYGITEAEWAACSDPSPLAHLPSTTACISMDDAVKPSRVRVLAPTRQVRFAFGPLFDADEVAIAAVAEASLRLREKSDCGLCIVGGGDHDFQNGDAFISGGDVAINGNINIQNNGLVSTDGIISVEGDATGPLDGYTPDPLTDQQPIEDPLENLVLPPDFSGLTARTEPCGPAAASGPGIYGDHNFGNEDCVLQPGLYVITGKWDFTGQATLDATSGVTLYVACGTTSAVVPCAAPGQQGGWLNAGGNGDIAITAPADGPTAGLAVVYDRLNTSNLEISGNGDAIYSGTIYAHSAKMRYDGNGCTKTHQSLIVVRTLEFNGNPACLQSTYDQDKNVYVPPDNLHLSR